MSEATNEISVRLGSAFALVAARFIPAVTEGVTRSKKKITFGATVECQLDPDGIVSMRLVPHEPKIATEPMDPMFFVLKRDPAGQLSFLFDGTIKEMKAAAEAMLEEPLDPDDRYEPGDNAGEEQ